jgi:hypothetical protein
MVSVASPEYHPEKQERRECRSPRPPVLSQSQSPTHCDVPHLTSTTARHPISALPYPCIHPYRVTVSIPSPPLTDEEYSHQPLQRTEFHALHPLPQPRNLLLDPRLRLLNLQLLHVRLLPYPPLLQVQVQPHTRLRPGDLIAEAGV